MKEFLKRLTSRKLWCAIAGIAVGLILVFKLDTDTIATIAGAVVSCVSAITYMVTEGKIDAAKVGQVIESVQDVAEVLTGTVEVEVSEEVDEENGNAI